MSEHKIRTSGKRMEMAQEVTLGGGSTAQVTVEDGAVTAVVITSPHKFVSPMTDDHPSDDDIDPHAWRLMDDAPADGTMIEVKEDPDQPDITAVMVRWYRTSVRDRALRKWVPAAWWRIAVTGERLGFEPFCWRVVEGFERPGMIVA